jgi:glycosyltransferase involved in cell wall biosynthesis
MKILHSVGRVGRVVHNPEDHALAGIGNAVLNIASAQSNILGHQVEVYGFSNPIAAGRGIWRGVNICTMQPVKFARISSRLNASWLLPMLWRVILQSNIDVLHVHELGLLYLPNPNLKIMHLHIPISEKAGRSHLWKRADAVVCVSHYVREKFLASSYYPPERTFVVHNGAISSPYDEIERIQIRAKLGILPKESMVLFVGALVPAKGPHILLEAIRELQNKHKCERKIRTVIVGGSRLWRVPNGDSSPGDYETELKSLGDGLNVTFVGLLPHKEIQSLYRASDIVVVPSIFEAHPLVVCEGMAAGKAVIASRVGGIPETVIDGETGILFPMGDIEALASAIQRLVENQEMRSQMGCAAMQRSKIFSWESAAKKLDQIYEEFL